MIYIYDVTINLNDDLINFYEWEETDILTKIKKTFLVRVHKEIYNMIIKNSITVGKQFLDSIKNKTEVISSKKTETLDYGCVFSNGYDALFVTFNKDGKILEKSKFLIDEEMEIIELTNNLSEKRIECDRINSNYKINTLRRGEKTIINLILNELKLVKNDKNKLNYLYFEWFDKKSEDKKAYEELIKSIKEGFTEKHREFLDILDLIIYNK